jgi:hypothetical protein
VLVELEEINPTQRLVAYLGFEDEPEQRRLALSDVREQTGVAELVARLFHGTQRAGDRVPAHQWIIGGRIEHPNIGRQFRSCGVDVRRPGSSQEALGCVHASMMTSGDVRGNIPPADRRRKSPILGWTDRSLDAPGRSDPLAREGEDFGEPIEPACPAHRHPQSRTVRKRSRSTPDGPSATLT